VNNRTFISFCKQCNDAFCFYTCMNNTSISFIAATLLCSSKKHSMTKESNAHLQLYSWIINMCQLFFYVSYDQPWIIVTNSTTKNLVWRRLYCTTTFMSEIVQYNKCTFNQLCQQLAYVIWPIKMFDGIWMQIPCWHFWT